MVPLFFVCASVISAAIAFLLIKDDFNIMFNFCILLIGCITAIFRTINRHASAGMIVFSIIIIVSSFLFVAMQDDFNATFMLAVAMTIGSHLAARFLKNKS